MDTETTYNELYKKYKTWYKGINKTVVLNLRCHIELLSIQQDRQGSHISSRPIEQLSLSFPKAHS